MALKGLKSSLFWVDVLASYYGLRRWRICHSGIITILRITIQLL